MQLQWGRDHLIAEIRRCQAAPDGGSLASMGPRSSDRGNHSTAEVIFFLAILLQWGRDHLIAEMTCLGVRQRGVLAAASMGPRSSDRGNARATCATSRRSSCFNGAAII